MELNLGIEITRITEFAAMTAAKYIGFGNANKVLRESRSSLARSLMESDLKATIINEPFDSESMIPPFPQMLTEDKPDIRFEMIARSIEGHKMTSYGGPNTASYIALAEKGTFLKLPPVYMNKIAVGREGHGIVDIEAPPVVNVKRLARAKNKYIDNITVCILDRERNRQIIDDIRKCGARIRLISDGEVSASMGILREEKIDMVMGIGSAQEGILTSAFMNCLGGYVIGKLYVTGILEKEKCEEAGITDLNKIYDNRSFLKSEGVTVAATGISDGFFLEGVKFTSDGALTESFTSRNESKTIRYISTRHYFDYKKIFNE